jgi:drug/metabolite transporter (DMT)-like permease
LKEKSLTKAPVVCLLTFICCFLWGSAFPCIKIGYQLLQISSGDTASQILFAGLRFTLAGFLTLLMATISTGKFPRAKRSSWKPILALSMTQTVIQYFFFYVGLAHATGVKSSIFEASSTFFAILIASLIFRYEPLTPCKILGCLIGFAGVILINVAGGGSLDLHFALNGEGFLLLSTLSYAFSSTLIKSFSASESPVTLSAYQFLVGGVILSVCGFLAGGRLTVFTPAAALLLVYMAFISAAAYSLWGILLKYNPVSRIAVFGFMTPVMGVLLSALLLGEKNQAFSLYGLVSLLLVCAGIFIVNRQTR